MRKELNDRLVEWLRQRAAGPFAGEVALVAAYGSHFNGTWSERSDVDCYFIPKTPRGAAFAADFILAGVGYDIFPLSWERAQGIARLEEPLVPLVGDATVLYCDTPEDGERFRALGEELARCLGDGAHCRAASRERLARAAAQYGLLGAGEGFSTQRARAGSLLMDAAEAVAFANGTYFHRGLKRQFQDLQAMERKPRGFLESYRAVIQAGTPQALEAACKALLDSLGEFLGLGWEAPPAQKGPAPQERSQNLAELAPWYEECCSTFQKVYACCGQGDWVLAFLSAACLQRELDGMTEGYQLPPFPVLEAYRWDRLEPLAQAAAQAEAALVGRIEGAGGQIKRYSSFEEFQAAGL